MPERYIGCRSGRRAVFLLKAQKTEKKVRAEL